MKKIIYIFVLLTFSIHLQAQSILITHFDPFGGKKSNNSEPIAKLVAQKLLTKGFDVEVCSLRTVYDKAYQQLTDCIHSAKVRPEIIISLGEGPCRGIKIETRAVNLKKGNPDNDGIQYNGEEIYPNETYSRGVSLPVEKAFCSLSSKQKKSISISQDAGTFVCNNTIYHSLRNIEIPSAFFHVPNSSCKKRGRSSNLKLSGILNDMVAYMARNHRYSTPQPSTKREVIQKLNSPLSSCEKKFYKTLKGEY